MIFRVLGCSGSESGQNHPCSFLIGDTLVVDMGSAASRLTQAEQCRVTDVLLSHSHLDHTKDLAFFAENIFPSAAQPVRVWGTSDCLAKVRSHLLNNETWPDFTVLPTPESPVLRFQTLEAGRPFRVGEVEVTAIPVNHSGGSVAFFFRSDKGTILYTSDTGPTDAIWEEAVRRRKEMRAVLVECSFPNRLDPLPDVSRHLTPVRVAAELRKIGSVQCPVFVYHIKSPYREETLKELAGLEDPRLRILEAGMGIGF
jgi:ribonuclease BN (tRNA processing enzyme)